MATHKYGSKYRRLGIVKSGGTNDGIYQESQLEFVESGELSAERCKVISDGSNGSANLIAACARSDIHVINFNNPKGGTYLLSSATDCNGKILKVQNGCILNVTGSLTNFILDAADNVQCFAVSSVVTPKGTAWGKLTPEHFGAKGDNTTEDAPAIQAAWNACKNMGVSTRLWLTEGKHYKASTTLDFLSASNITPSLEGVNLGRGIYGSSIVWHGAEGGTLVRCRKWQYTKISNISLTAGPSSGGTNYCKYIIHFDVDSTTNLCQAVSIENSSFSGARGTGSMLINVNATGLYTNYQCSEFYFDNLLMNGVGYSAATPTDYGIGVGGFNTKGFYISRSRAYEFKQAFFKTTADAGIVNDWGNLVSACGINFDLHNGSHLHSDSHYSESSGQFLKMAQGATNSTVQITNLNWNADNYDGHIVDYPVTQTYIIEGRGNLVIQSSKFKANASRVKINWDSSIGNISSVTSISNHYSAAKEGVSPFFSAGVEHGQIMRNESGEQFAPINIISLNDKGVINDVVTDNLPNWIGSDLLIKGLSKISAGNGLPTTGRWYAGDERIESANYGDARATVKRWLCTRSGTYKTINVTGNTTSGSPWIASISSLSALAIGDLIDVSTGFNNNDFPYEVLEIDTAGNRFRVVSNASATVSTITITNFIPVWQAWAGGFGTTANRPTLGVNDVNFKYFDTTIGIPITWTGTAWFIPSSSSVLFAIRTITVSESALASDDTILGNTAAGNIVLTVNPTTMLGKRLTVKKISSDSNTVTITSSSGTIDGDVSRNLLEENESMMVHSNGTNFYII